MFQSKFPGLKLMVASQKQTLSSTVISFIFYWMYLLFILSLDHKHSSKPPTFTFGNI